MALLAGTLVLLSSCEADRATQSEIFVEPSFANVGKGDSVAFKASGWHDYTWSLGTPSLGILSRTKGDVTVYTSIFSGGATQVLTVVGGAGTEPPSGTNDAVTGKAFVPSTDVTIVHH